MRQLARPDVMRASAMAAIVSFAVCWPRLVLWQLSPRPLGILCLVFLWAAFFLWSIVFAWGTPWMEKGLFGVRGRRSLWAIAAGGGVLGAFILDQTLDPTLRVLHPEQYPSSVIEWLALTLFNLGFEQLFVCLAPFAFFVRLTHRPKAAVVATVAFNLLIVILKLKASAPLPPALIVAEIAAFRTVSAFLSLFLFVRGGIPVVLCVALIIQARHLIHLL